ncbi:MAG: C45 family peptidase [Opitutaceae bacterium]|jgi:hypothetical protein|nr:C45 family peptidase [Opitutaceae bacterium]
MKAIWKSAGAPFVLLAGFMLSAGPVSPARACTLFAGAGAGWVEGGGTLIAKNRDEAPAAQALQLVTNAGRYDYYILAARGRGDTGNYSARWGMNEKGLVIATSTAGPVPKSKRSRPGNISVFKAVLPEYATVDEVLENKKIFGKSNAQNIIMADRNKIICVEVGPEGVFSIKETADGTLCHTNHYVFDDMQWANMSAPGESSQIRLARIRHLLKGKKEHSLDDFIRHSEDRAAGANNSIWRDGLSAGASQTMAVVIARLPKEGEPSVYIKMRRNPGEKGREEIHRLTLKEIFGGKTEKMAADRNVK